MAGVGCGPKGRSSPAFIYGDNQSVLANTMVPSSQLKKKSNSIAYHFVREGCARDEWRTDYVVSAENQSDILSKPLPAGAKREKLVGKILHHVCGKANGVEHESL